MILVELFLAAVALAGAAIARDHARRAARLNQQAWELLQAVALLHADRMIHDLDAAPHHTTVHPN